MEKVECGCVSCKGGNKHPYKSMVLDGESVKIDKKIYKLIKELNKNGIKTTQSCQGDEVGYIMIELGKNITATIMPSGYKDQPELMLEWTPDGSHILSHRD